MDIQVAKVLAAALALIPIIAVAISIGRIFSAAIEAIARNPVIKDNVFPLALLGAAFAETGALFALVVALIILFF